MTQLTLYNTLSRQKEAFKPIDPANIRMYACGPTVYDYAHIGNARPVIVFDVLFRLLRQLHGEDRITYVRNITDVDDKINARALRDYGDDIRSGALGVNEAIRKVTERTENQFLADAAELGCLEPTNQPRATEHIEGMITMIAELIAKGHAYVAEGDEGREVLFDVASMPEYGQLSKRKLEDQQAGARVAVEAHKKSPEDFVLWKESSTKEPGWEATFDGTAIYGRPGWHIECSVMSKAFLGEVFDIHAGGLDLIFPHHENEIAQSRCAHGTDVMANYWLHNGFLQVEGQKMSKSLGNFVTIHELLATDKFGGRSWPGQVLRLAMLMTHYREPIDFSVRRLEEAEDRLRGWQRAADASADAKVDGTVIAELSDDLNFHRAAVAMDVMARKANRGEAEAAHCLAATLAFLGFSSELADAAGADDTDIAAIAERRLALLAEKNFAEADRIRDELAEQGIQLMDYKDPDTGERRTKWEVKR